MEVHVSPEMRAIARTQCTQLQQQAGLKDPVVPASFEKCMDAVATLKREALCDYLAVCDLRLNTDGSNDLQNMNAHAQTLLAALRDIISRDEI